ncbi:MAG: stage 0 sporulation family protein [Lachnospiraceae bacterium]|nr:stage 0 sporulation family protein [Lachnospiraceae bacterium]
MKEVIGVRFRENGKIYFFDPLRFNVQVGEYVIVETARGVEYGKVVLGRREIDEKKMSSAIKPIIRIAEDKDHKKYEDNKEKNKKAYNICLEKITKHKLDMKLIDAEYTFDNSKVLFYFTADGRIDFRELVKDLAAVFKTRIELRQIGVRDETKIVGGIGICGRELCCNKHLSEFIPVSIRMAKEQNLSLNPTKISGVCGRLMCCLKHEQDTYEYLNDRLPNIGDVVKTADGRRGEVKSVNVLRQKVMLVFTLEDDSKEQEEFKIEDLRFKPKKRRNDDRDRISDAELKKLEALERQEGKSKLDDA